jgi:nucleoside-diphosphate-sugar epimerase
MDQAMNANLTRALATHALHQSASRFIYISSMRVYGGLLGVVDEQTPAKPHPADDYGFTKLACEALVTQKLANKIPLSLCRIGSVFSDRTSRKFPVPLNSRGKFLQKGQSTHLISANNVADALGHILLSEPVSAARIYNITQEADGLNDYCRLADQLADCEQASATYMTSSCGRWIRHLMFSLRSQAHSGPYLQVLENQLISEGFSYKCSVISDLRDCAA